MWKPEHRRAADRYGLRYPSDLSDSEWALIEPAIPPAKTWWASARGERPRGSERYLLCALDGLPVDIAIRSSGAGASYPVFVHRLAPLFHASFRPRLAATALALH